MTWVLAAGDLLAHYRILSPLGSGGMGQVYLAEDERLGRRLALKVLSPRWLRDDERLQRFQREARAILALNHPNILTVYDVGADRGIQFLATEYIDGVTLRRLLERGALEVRQAVAITRQIAQAIAAAHGAGVIHRDLKPENVMIRADARRQRSASAAPLRHLRAPRPGRIHPKSLSTFPPPCRSCWLYHICL